MTRPPDAVPSYKVVCPVFVSASFETAKDAQLHLELTKVFKCPGPHRVEYTDRPYGTTGGKG